MAPFLRHHGILWCSERQGAFSNALSAEQEGRDINPARARQGFLARAALQQLSMA
ncbi:MAG: hypothetical protein ACYCRE_07180 [Acidobacteriaceae bacterium]